MEDTNEKEKSVKKIIDEVCEEICDNYCKYTEIARGRDDYNCGHWDDCPLNRLR